MFSDKKMLIKPLLFGLIFSILVTFMFLIIFAVAATNLNFDDNVLLTLSLISMNLGAFIGGLISGKITKEKGFIIGAINGFIVFLIFSLISVIFNPNSITIITLIKLITLTLSSMIGGVVGVNINNKIHF